MLISLRFIFLTLVTRLNQIVRVIKAILLNQISYYPKFVKTFEKEFKKKTNSSYSLMFSNATSAMEAALFAGNVNCNSKILSTAFVIPSSYSPAFSLGADIVFLDIDENNLNLDIKILEKFDSSITALIVTHFYGNPCDMETIMNWANKNNIFVVEDCSHAHGALYKDKPIGSWGDVGIFSLQGAKAIAAGEGAIAISNKSEIMLKMAAYGHQESYKSFGIKADKEIFLPSFGYGKKMRAHPLGAILAHEELKIIDKKNAIFSAWHNEIYLLSLTSNVYKVPDILNDALIGGFCQGIPLIIKNTSIAQELKNTLLKEKINCFMRSYSQPLIEFSSVYNSEIDIKNELPNSYLNFSKVIFIPFYQFLSPFRWLKLKSILKNKSDA